MNLSDLSQRWSAFWRSPTGIALFKYGRWVVTAAIVSLLIYQLSKIGWTEVLANLPSNGLFYFFIGCSYLILPILDSIMYSKIWSVRPAFLFYAMVKKKIYNQEVLGYSGEIFLYAWAKTHISETGRHILYAIKDNIIISSITSTIVAFSLLGFYLYAGGISVTALLGDRTAGFLLLVVLFVIVLMAVMALFRKSLLFLSKRLLVVLFGLHTTRLLLTQLFMVLMWNSVLPEVAITTWFTYLAVQIIISRIPLVPNKDLVFMGAGIELSSTVGIPAAQIAGMLLVVSGMEKLFNASLFAFISIRTRKSGEKEFSIDEVEDFQGPLDTPTP